MKKTLEVNTDFLCSKVMTLRQQFQLPMRIRKPNFSSSLQTFPGISGKQLKVHIVQHLKQITFFFFQNKSEKFTFF